MTRPGPIRSDRRPSIFPPRPAQKFGEIADLTKEEAKTVVDFLIERKKAGQFRTLHSAFEEQVQLLTNKEVDVINCWEPAVREANLKLGAGTTKYAYTVEGYFKWGHGAYIASQAKDRGNLDNIYKVLNYFLGGEYRALQARDRGYAGPNMDLGVEYATKAGLEAGGHRRAQGDREEGRQEVREALRQHHDANELRCDGRGVAALPERLISLSGMALFPDTGTGHLYWRVCKMFAWVVPR